MGGGGGGGGLWLKQSSYDALQVQLLADKKLVTDSTHVHAAAHIVSGLMILSAYIAASDGQGVVAIHKALLHALFAFSHAGLQRTPHFEAARSAGTDRFCHESA